MNAKQDLCLDEVIPYWSRRKFARFIIGTAVVSKSWDMAYSSRTYELTMNDASGKPVNDRGKYLEVWTSS